MANEVSWDALRVFMAVYRAGSFSAGADELGLAQSSVSEQIARLERKLGHALLERSPAGARPTDRGRELAARIGGAVDAMGAVTDFAADPAAAPRPVFLGGPAEFCSEVILPALPELLPPQVRVMARFGMAEELIDDLRAGRIDVLVSALPVRGSGVTAEPIHDEEFALVAHPRWREQAAAGLDAIPLLGYGPELPIVRRYWRSVFGHRPSTQSVPLVVPDLRALLRLALAGAGMTVLPDYLVREHLRSGELVLLHAPEVAPLNTIFVATAVRAGQDATVQAVRAAIVQIARELDERWASESR